MTPLRIAALGLVLIAVLFEPTRLALHDLEDEVGGVGGIGGLTNQFAPSPSCNRTANFIDFYCFNKGLSSLFGLRVRVRVNLSTCTLSLSLSH